MELGEIEKLQLALQDLAGLLTGIGIQAIPFIDRNNQGTTGLHDEIGNVRILIGDIGLGIDHQDHDVGIFDLIGNLRDRGLTILLVEQNVAQSLDIADRGYVLANGRIELQGSAADLRASPEIQDAYLGA